MRYRAEASDSLIQMYPKSKLHQRRCALNRRQSCDVTTQDQGPIRCSLKANEQLLKKPEPMFAGLFYAVTNAISVARWLPRLVLLGFFYFSI